MRPRGSAAFASAIRATAASSRPVQGQIHRGLVVAERHRPVRLQRQSTAGGGQVPEREGATVERQHRRRGVEIVGRAIDHHADASLRVERCRSWRPMPAWRSRRSCLPPPPSCRGLSPSRRGHRHGDPAGRRHRHSSCRGCAAGCRRHSGFHERRHAVRSARVHVRLAGREARQSRIGRRRRPRIRTVRRACRWPPARRHATRPSG